MKKMLFSLAIIGLAYFSADAQIAAINACGKKQGKVCIGTRDGKTTSCYKTKFAESYKVCKNDNGYFICCETPTSSNSTFSWFSIAGEQQSAERKFPYAPFPGSNAPLNATVPQSQSYLNTPAGSR